MYLSSPEVHQSAGCNQDCGRAHLDGCTHEPHGAGGGGGGTNVPILSLEMRTQARVSAHTIGLAIAAGVLTMRAWMMTSVRNEAYPGV